jgi:hypothetical protein
MPLRPYVFGIFERGCQIFHCTRVERSLKWAEMAPGLEFSLVRSIRDGSLVGLHAMQNIRPHQRTQLPH